MVLFDTVGERMHRSTRKMSQKSAIFSRAKCYSSHNFWVRELKFGVNVDLLRGHPAKDGFSQFRSGFRDIAIFQKWKFPKFRKFFTLTSSWGQGFHEIPDEYTPIESTFYELFNHVNPNILALTAWIGRPVFLNTLFWIANFDLESFMGVLRANGAW